MIKRVAVVTGSNKGIGLAVVRALCSKFEGDVFLTARDENRGKEAVKILEKEGLNPKFHVLDITKSDSIKILALFLKKHYDGVDILVNNAAIAYRSPDQTPFEEQAFETINTNFFATLEVCHQLFPLLRKHARVVNLSSSAGHISRIPNKDLQQKFLAHSLTEEELSCLMNQFVQDAKEGVHEEKGWGKFAYPVSKVGVTALTILQQKTFSLDSEKDIVVNAVHPGYVYTDMNRDKGVLTPDQGAEAVVYCALLPPDVKSPRGEYIWNDKTIKPWIP